MEKFSNLCFVGEGLGDKDDKRHAISALNSHGSVGWNPVVPKHDTMT